MAKTKISEFSATPANNTDIDSINIAEGCAPSGINDAIRELMAQLKDFQTGAVGDSFNGPIGTSTAAAGAFTTLSASGTATLSGLTASTALALDASKNVVSVTNTGTGNNVLATSPTLVTPILGTPTSGNFSTGTFTWPTFNQNTTGTAAGLSATLAIASGGTGQTTANAAFNALAPSQTSASGKYLKSDGTNTSWDALDISTADITGTLPVANGGTGVTSSTGTGSVVLSNSPTLVTPILGTPQSGNFSTGTFTWPTFNQNTTGTAAGLSATLATTSGGTGLTSFTSGGVVYASSSSALATGSVFTFDGTNLGLGGTTNSYGSQTTLTLSGTNVSRIDFRSNSTYTGSILSYQSTGEGLRLQTESSLPIAFSPNGTEGMRLTTTGLGIGTSSPAARLQVEQNSANTTVRILRTGYGYTDLIGGTGSSGNDFKINMNGTDRMFIESSTGNVGIGTSSPSSKLDVVRSATTTTAFDESVIRAINTGAATLNQRVDIAMRWQDGTYNGIGGISMLRESATARSGSLSLSSIDSSGNPTNGIRLNSTGAVALLGASTTANGVGITFPATQSASSNANTLDDYEEGTWTPTIALATAGTSSTSGAVGKYTKVGNLVTVVGRITITKGTGTGDLSLGGLPFASVSLFGYQSAGTLSTDEFGVVGKIYQILLVSNSTTPNFLAISQINGAAATASASDFGAGGATIRYAISYQTE